MIAINLNIKDEVYDKVMYLLNSLPKQDVQIASKRIIPEIDVTNLSKNDFDYISKEDLKKIDDLSAKIKNDKNDDFIDFEELKNEL
jgi:hypothetical protein